MEKLPHTLSFLDTSDFEPTEEQSEQFEEVTQVELQFVKTEIQEKRSKRFNYKLYQIANLFQAQSDRIELVLPEQEEVEEEKPKKPKKSSRKHEVIKQEPEVPPEVDWSTIDAISKWFELVQSILTKCYDFQIKIVNFVGINSELQKLISDCFKDTYELEFYNLPQLSLATMPFQRHFEENNEICVFSYYKQQCCYYRVKLDYSQILANNTPEFMKQIKMPQYFSYVDNSLEFFDPSARKDYVQYLSFDEKEQKFIAPNGYRGLRFRESLKQSFRHCLDLIFYDFYQKQMKQVKCCISDGLIEEQFEMLREPSAQRVLTDIKNSCLKYCPFIKFEPLSQFDNKIFVVLHHCNTLIEQIKSFNFDSKQIRQYTKSILNECFKTNLSEDIIQQAAIRNKQFNELQQQTDNFSAIISAKLNNSDNNDQFIQKLLVKIQQIQRNCTTKCDIKLAFSKEFLTSLKSEFGDEFVEEEHEKEADKEEEKQEEEKQEQDGEQQQQGDEQQPDGEQQLGDAQPVKRYKYPIVIEPPTYEIHQNTFLKNLQQMKLPEELPEQPEINALQAITRDIQKNFVQPELKRVLKRWIKYYQQDIVVIVKGCSQFICQPIMAQISSYLEQTCTIYTDCCFNSKLSFSSPYFMISDFIDTDYQELDASSQNYQINQFCAEPPQDQATHNSEITIAGPQFMQYALNSRMQTGKLFILADKSIQNIQSTLKQLEASEKAKSAVNGKKSAKAVETPENGAETAAVTEEKAQNAQNDLNEPAVQNEPAASVDSAKSSLRAIVANSCLFAVGFYRFVDFADILQLQSFELEEPEFEDAEDAQEPEEAEEELEEEKFISEEEEEAMERERAQKQKELEEEKAKEAAEKKKKAKKGKTAKK